VDPVKAAWKWIRKESLVVMVVGLYLWALAVSPSRAGEALLHSFDTMMSVSLIIVSVFAALGLFSALVDKQAFGKRLSKDAGVGMLLIASAFGTVLIGPVYAVFPLLKTFREHGARWGVIVAVITAWAVKIPVIPLEMRFMGWEFSVVRSLLTVVAAVGMGLLFDRIMPDERNSHE
jgi:uncharacterized membrane protein YraQ (UPF0718 family)